MGICLEYLSSQNTERYWIALPDSPASAIARMAIMKKGQKSSMSSLRPAVACHAGRACRCQPGCFFGCIAGQHCQHQQSQHRHYLMCSQHRRLSCAEGKCMGWKARHLVYILIWSHMCMRLQVDSRIPCRIRGSGGGGQGGCTFRCTSRRLPYAATGGLEEV